MIYYKNKYTNIIYIYLLFLKYIKTMNQELIKLTDIIDNKILNNINHPDINYYLNYLCNILDNYDISINDYLIKLNISLRGYLSLFKDCYIYSNLLYDILTYKTSNTHYIIKIYLNPLTDIKYIQKFINQYKIYETNKYDIYMINDLEIHLYKNYINPLEILIKGKNNENNFLLYENKILTHQINYYKLYNINDVYINEIEDYKINIVDKICNNKYNEIEIKEDTLDIILNISVYLSKNKLIDECMNIIIEKNMINYFTKNKNVLFNAIKNNKIYIFQKIKNSNIKFNLDIINNDGYNLVEYCLINLNKITKEIIEIIKDYNYNRNPRYIDFILNINIIDNKIKNEYEKIFYDKITKLQINNCENIQLINNLIIDSMYSIKEINPKEEYKIDVIIDFIRFNYKFINKSMLFKKLEQMNSIIVVKNLFIENILNINDNENTYEILKLICYFNLFDYLKTYKKYVKIYSYKLLKYCIDINNLKSFIGILLIDKYNIYSKDDFENNILHYICNHNDIKDIEVFIKACIKYNENIYNDLNKRNETCLYNCVDNDNINAFKFLLTYDNINIINKNIDEENILFYIIKKNKLDFLKILFNNELYVKQLINTNDKYNNTPIIYATKNKNKDMINYIYKFNPDLDKMDNNGNYINHYIGLYALNTDIKNIKNIKNKDNKTTKDYLYYNIYNISNLEI